MGSDMYSLSIRYVKFCDENDGFIETTPKS